MSDQFNVGVRVGMAIIVLASAASAFAVGGVLLYIAYSAVTIHRNASRRWTTDTHIHYYFLNLMFSDLIQAVGGLLNIKWIVEAVSLPRIFRNLALVHLAARPCTPVLFALSKVSLLSILLHPRLSWYAGFFKQVGDVGVAFRYVSKLGRNPLYVFIDFRCQYNGTPVT
ncbi:hypothetical protein M404DRAFT_937671 [Pisolithus tinctorius Marx 270]|uniref:Uncharacterized protein n=1 Tax=Pisolithus tinctorius Marx 270 TaxID=870435 RepID=A0A0C3PIK9_PISTI|nr:hypothetical protein M404DRAFT_937671 [Pisolithus tinctorius Marx 270]